MFSSISKERSLFLLIIKNYIHGEKTSVALDSDWNLLNSYAVKHQLAPIFYHQCKNLSADIKPLYVNYCASIYLNANREQVLSEFKRILADIPNIQVKGVVLSGLYSPSFLRTMGDIDTLIHPEDQETVHNRLIENGFTFLKEGRGEWSYRKNGFLFEVHEQLVHDYKGKEKLIEYFSHAWEYVRDGVLDWNFHFLYLMEHLHQHLVGEGVGFRQFLDIALVCKQIPLDWDWITEQLQILGLLEFAKKVFSFNQRWFAVSCPIECEELDEEFYIQATLKIFEDGVFGHENLDNQGSGISFVMTYEGKTYEQARNQYFLSRIFPSYKELCRSYPYLNRSRLLYPAAWVQRAYRLCFDKSQRERIAESMDRGHTEDRQDLLRKWGL